MQQDTFFYHNFSQDAQLQYPNTNSYGGQSSTISLSPNYIPQVNVGPAQSVTSPYNYGNHMQPNITPVSTAAYGPTPTFSWAHTVPSFMPWVTKGDLNVPDPVMRFTAPFPPDPCTSQTATSWELLNNLGASKANPNLHLKRKSDIDIMEVATPHKMCITEEKMAARLKDLHISNQYSVPQENSPFGPYNNSSSDMAVKSVSNLQQLESLIKESNAEGQMMSKSLILAPELKKLVEPEKIFSATFLDKIERPSMAIVVWEPPNKLLPNLKKVESNTEDEKEKQDELSISLTKAINNNFISTECSAICNENRSLEVSNEMRDVSSSFINCEDVMDT